MSWEKEGAAGWALPGYGAESMVNHPDENGPEKNRSTGKQPKHTENEGGVTAIVMPNMKRTGSLTSPHLASQLQSIPRAQLIRPPHAVSYDHPVVPHIPVPHHILKKSWLEGKKPDAIVRLPATFGSVKPNFLKIAGISKGMSFPTIGNEVMKRIGLATGTWIRPSRNGDRCLHIWGEHQKAEQARCQLLQLIRTVSSSTSSKSTARFRTDDSDAWVKIHPGEFDLSQGLVREELIRNRVKITPQPPGSEPKFILEWPLKGSSIEKGIEKMSEKFDPIREEFNINIQFYDEDSNYILVQGYKDIDLTNILERLQILWETTGSKIQIDVKLYLVDPVPMGEMRNRILLIKQAKFDFARPFLYGDTINPTTINQFLEDNDKMLQKNNECILKSFKEALMKSQPFLGHLRMRIHFGAFVYDTYQPPDKTQNGHLFHQFQEMILKDKARGRLLPGLRMSEPDPITRCIQAEEILEQFDSQKTLHDIETMTPDYSIGVEFTPRSGFSTHLEMLYKGNSDTMAPTQIQWLKDGHEKGGMTKRHFALQLGVINFTGSDWQGGIEYFETIDTKELDSDLRGIPDTIIPSNLIKSYNMRSKPFMKVKLRNDTLVRSIIEKSAIQLRVKGTSYVLELARFDHYIKLKDGWSKVPKVSWGASLFDPAWNKFLGNQLVSKTRQRSPSPYQGLACLFPPTVGTEQSNVDADDESGFREFIEIVRIISDILGTDERLSGIDPGTRSSTNLLDADLGMLF